MEDNDFDLEGPEFLVRSSPSFCPLRNVRERTFRNFIGLNEHSAAFEHTGESVDKGSLLLLFGVSSSVSSSWSVFTSVTWVEDVKEI